MVLHLDDKPAVVAAMERGLARLAVEAPADCERVCELLRDAGWSVSVEVWFDGVRVNVKQPMEDGNGQVAI